MIDNRVATIAVLAHARKTLASPNSWIKGATAIDATGDRCGADDTNACF